MISIDGTVYNVPVKKLKRNAAMLDKYAERTIDGKLHRELIGVYFNYELDFGQTLINADYNLLWDKLTEAKEFHTIRIPDEKGFVEFQAYISSISDEFMKVLDDDVTRYMKNLKCKFIAQIPIKVPTIV